MKGNVLINRRVLRNVSIQGRTHADTHFHVFNLKKRSRRRPPTFKLGSCHLSCALVARGMCSACDKRGGAVCHQCYLKANETGINNCAVESLSVAPCLSLTIYIS